MSPQDYNIINDTIPNTFNYTTLIVSILAGIISYILQNMALYKSINHYCTIQSIKQYYQLVMNGNIWFSHLFILITSTLIGITIYLL